MLNFINENKIDKILVTELSRLSRDKEFLKKIILETLNLNCSIFFVDLNIETLKDSQLNINCLTVLYDEIDYANKEIMKIRSRIERGYNSFREGGGKVGRKKGFRNTDAQLLLKHEEVVELLIKGLSVRSVMLVCNKSSGVVQKIKKILEKNGSLSKDTKTLKTNDLLKKILENPGGKSLLDF
jgi:DNA invertase Pin-like site-specific DNA recombinase